MTTMHDEWTDRLSEYLDDELTPDERYAVDSHLSECEHCAVVLDELRLVVARARALETRPPGRDLWPGVASRIEPQTSSARATPLAPRPRRTIELSLPQLAAAAALLMAISAGLVWSIAARRSTGATAGTVATAQPANTVRSIDLAPGDPSVATVSSADAQYDAAVAELQAAMQKGRGHLDASTIAIVEHNLQIIDDAIEQARQALASDPANTYLSGHLFEARRRKLDLLRRTAALLAESD